LFVFLKLSAYILTQLISATRKSFERFILVFQMSREPENPDSQKYVAASAIQIDQAFVLNLW